MECTAARPALPAPPYPPRRPPQLPPPAPSGGQQGRQPPPPPPRGPAAAGLDLSPSHLAEISGRKERRARPLQCSAVLLPTLLLPSCWPAAVITKAVVPTSPQATTATKKIPTLLISYGRYMTLCSVFVFVRVCSVSYIP